MRVNFVEQRIVNDALARAESIEVTVEELVCGHLDQKGSSSGEMLKLQFNGSRPPGTSNPGGSCQAD